MLGRRGQLRYYNLLPVDVSTPPPTVTQVTGHEPSSKFDDSITERGPVAHVLMSFSATRPDAPNTAKL